MTLLAQANKMQGASWSSSSVRFNCHLKCCITAIYSPDSSSTSTYQSSPDFFQFCNKVPSFDLHNFNNSPQFIFQTSTLCFFSLQGQRPCSGYLFCIKVLFIGTSPVKILFCLSEQRVPAGMPGDLLPQLTDNWFVGHTDQFNMWAHYELTRLHVDE